MKQIYFSLTGAVYASLIVSLFLVTFLVSFKFTFADTLLSSYGGYNPSKTNGYNVISIPGCTRPLADYPLGSAYGTTTVGLQGVMTGGAGYSLSNILSNVATGIDTPNINTPLNPAICVLDAGGGNGDLQHGLYYPVIFGGTTLSNGDYYIPFFFGTAGPAWHYSGYYAHFVVNNNVITGQVNPDPFYSQIKNTSSGVWSLRSGPSLSSSKIKTLPEDWIVQVSSTTDATGNPVTSDGYTWYQVIDPTDNAAGWMAAASGTTQYLLDDITQQSALEASSTNYVATSSRPALILNAIDHYYNNSDSVGSLYSSDDPDSEDGANNLSLFKDKGYSEKLIWGIAAAEDGPNFDNQKVTFDYGHGIMQSTFNALYYEQHESTSSAAWDNRGIGSRVKIPLCASVGTSAYTRCYTDAGTGSNNPKPYKHFDDDIANPIYQEYSDTEQSIYANIKDGLKVLQNGFVPVCDSTSSVITVGPYSYDCIDRMDVLSTANYNGTSTYLGSVANRLRNITTYFPTADTSDIADTISKLDYASSSLVYAQLHSPGDLSIADSKGHTIGTVNGKNENSFQFASYDPLTKSVHIFFPQDANLSYVVVGTGAGVYGLDIAVKNGGETLSFSGKAIPITPGETHIFTIDKNALKASRDDAVSVRIIKAGKTIHTIKLGPSATGIQFSAEESAQSQQ